MHSICIHDNDGNFHSKSTTFVAFGLHLCCLIMADPDGTRPGTSPRRKKNSPSPIRTSGLDPTARSFNFQVGLAETGAAAGGRPLDQSFDQSKASPSPADEPSQPSSLTSSPPTPTPTPRSGRGRPTPFSPSRIRAANGAPEVLTRVEDASGKQQLTVPGMCVGMHRRLSTTSPGASLPHFYFATITCAASTSLHSP